MARKPDKHKQNKRNSRMKAKARKRAKVAAVIIAKKHIKKSKLRKAKKVVTKPGKAKAKLVKAKLSPARKDRKKEGRGLETAANQLPDAQTDKSHTLWSLNAGEPRYDIRSRALIARLESDLAEHMERSKPGRYLHSLSVAHTAEQMALQYGVDPLQARIAGLLHDWDKVLTTAEQIALATRLGIDLGVDLHLVQPLLHGMTAAKRLADIYPELPKSIWQAIARHTLGAKDMTPLDMVLFVADGIEPRRRDVPAIRHVRQLVDDATPLEEVYWASFYHGVAYVIDTERYLYPGTLDIYNHLALHREAQKR